ncbi:hypothetical protein H072_163 [Dactylellina haptotyla CBS 200.50]|uniref:Uncharacterized protein n=1 Tax=Dactylellina haptotyla (strain CBS 200.50) TaxID=1284197 RepID=S8AS46_DACHA|nr:hypothetical protein H072_163 [Dactylellina haptotyla CBS 200.50]
MARQRALSPNSLRPGPSRSSAPALPRQNASSFITLAEEHYLSSNTAESFKYLNKALSLPDYNIRKNTARAKILGIFVFVAFNSRLRERALPVAKDDCLDIIKQLLFNGEYASQLLHDALYCMSLLQHWSGEATEASFYKLIVLRHCLFFRRDCGSKALLKHWNEFNTEIAVDYDAKSRDLEYMWLKRPRGIDAISTGPRDKGLSIQGVLVPRRSVPEAGDKKDQTVSSQRLSPLRWVRIVFVILLAIWLQFLWRCLTSDREEEEEEEG